MKANKKDKFVREDYPEISGEISTRLLIVMAVAGCIVFVSSLIAFSKKDPASKTSQENVQLADAAPAGTPQAPAAQKRTPPPNTPPHKIRLFADVDLDGDGVMTREEYEEAHWKNFERCDKNKDGMLERAEFPWAAIVAHDKNKDAKLDRDEYKNRYYEGFNDTDKNKDGVIFVEEI